MYRMTALALVAMCSLGSVAVAAAAQTETAEAAMAASQRRADCPQCEYEFISASPDASARRGLVTVGIGDPRGGGAAMIMAYTGSRWDVLWDGNGTTRDVESLPGRVAICMSQAGWTNVREGPGTTYARAGKVSRPTIKKVFEMRLETPGREQEGIGWYRISHRGKPAWVQNLRTFAASTGGPTSACKKWQEMFDFFGPRQ